MIILHAAYGAWRPGNPWGFGKSEESPTDSQGELMQSIYTAVRSMMPTSVSDDCITVPDMHSTWTGGAARNPRGTVTYQFDGGEGNTWPGRRSGFPPPLRYLRTQQAFFTGGSGGAGALSGLSGILTFQAGAGVDATLNQIIQYYILIMGTWEQYFLISKISSMYTMSLSPDANAGDGGYATPVYLLTLWA